MKATFVLAVVGLMFGGCTNRDTPEPPDIGIHENYKKAVAAELAGDATAFAALFVSDWRGIMNGQSITLDQVPDMFKIQKWDRDDITVQEIRLINSETAVVTAIGRSAFTVTDGPNKGAWEQTDHILDVFVRQDGKWLCAASHWATDPTSRKGPSDGR